MPMFVKVISGTILGIEAHPVDVEVDVSSGLPQFYTVGLPDTAVRESKDRIKSAIKNSGYPFPRHRVTVNLAPADIKKEGSGFDLPIAVAILAAEEMVPQEKILSYLFMGELSLDGGIKGVQGTLSAALRAKEMGLKGIILSSENAPEASMVNGIDVIGIKYLHTVVDFLGGRTELQPEKSGTLSSVDSINRYPFDFSDVGGQEQAKRALEIAAAGNHNILMVGPPGSGKSMLAKRILTILPKLSLEEAIETTKIFSVAGLLGKNELIVGTRPFRSPHHSISDAGLVGGGHVPRPGEISLAHNGVLFLDELPEFKRNVLEVLRQPLEERCVTIARSATSVTYPSNFMLVAAMNPCPCGNLASPLRTCRCTQNQIRNYRARISGPLLDRIDIHIEVPAARYKDISGRGSGEPSMTIRKRVREARKIQYRRYGRAETSNATMSSRDIRVFCRLDTPSRNLMEMAIDKLGLSARAYTRILKVARTIADLDNTKTLTKQYISEAIQYRTLDRKLF